MSTHAQQFAERCLSALSAVLPEYGESSRATPEMIRSALEGSYEAFQLMLEQQDTRRRHPYIKAETIPPAKEDVALFFTNLGSGADPEDFYDYYNAQGWKLSNGNLMKSWTSSANRWHRNYLAKQQGKPNQTSASLGALQIQLEKMNEEIRDIVRPGGSAHSRSATSLAPAEMERYEQLCAMRNNLRKRIEGGL